MIRNKPQYEQQPAAKRDCPRRSIALGGILLMYGLLLAGGLIVLLQERGKEVRQAAEKHYLHDITINGQRGVIWDRNDKPLAISAPVYSVSAEPRKYQLAELPQEHVTALAETLGADVDHISEQLRSGKTFVYLRHLLSPEEAEAVRKLGIAGINTESGTRRFYPNGYLTSQVVGFTDYSNQGKEGVERVRHSVLQQRPGTRRVLRSSGKELDQFSKNPPRDGSDIRLAIDLRLQFLAYQALEAAVDKHNAKAGSIILVDLEDGSIAVMANYPSYNPNTRTGNPAARRNRAIQDAYELGSTMKPVVTAIALKHGFVTPNTVLDTEKPPRYGGHVIADKNPRKSMTVAKMIEISSNVGAVRMADKIPAPVLWRELRDLGFGSSLHTGFPGETSGRLRHFRNWYPIDKATLSFGHGLSASLLHITSVYGALCGGGVLPRMQLISGEGFGESRRVFPEKVARQAVAMMEGVITGEKGTAPQAAVPGYRVAGKTGTSHKIGKDGSYLKKTYRSMFIGCAPASQPRFVVAVMVDEPRRGGYYGGTVAGPAFSSLMEHALRLYGVPPDGVTVAEGIAQ